MSLRMGFFLVALVSSFGLYAQESSPTKHFVFKDSAEKLRAQSQNDFSSPACERSFLIFAEKNSVDLGSMSREMNWESEAYGRIRVQLQRASFLKDQALLALCIESELDSSNADLQRELSSYFENHNLAEVEKVILNAKMRIR